MEPVPDFLTIEETARVLRIGRTKAYAMGQQWRTTEGKSGIKVCEFGGQLRVPLAWLEDQLGAPLRSIPTPSGQTDKSESADQKQKAEGSAAEPVAPSLKVLPQPEAVTELRPQCTCEHASSDQLTLPLSA